MFFTESELKIIYKQVKIGKSTHELSMLIYLIFETKLKVCDLLGWFSNNSAKRQIFLQKQQKFELLEDYEMIPVLFRKKHQTYLLQWKKACFEWTGKGNVTFQTLRQSIKKIKFNIP